MDYKSFVLIIIGLILVVGTFAPIVIEATKSLVTVKDSKKLALVVGGILSFITYAIYILFYVIGKYELVTLDIVKLIVIGLMYMFSCCVGSQVGYDKVYKPLIDLFKGEK